MTTTLNKVINYIFLVFITYIIIDYYWYLAIILTHLFDRSYLIITYCQYIITNFFTHFSHFFSLIVSIYFALDYERKDKYHHSKLVVSSICDIIN